jgi:hypothetical protein
MSENDGVYTYKYLDSDQLLRPVRMALGEPKLEYSQVLALKAKLDEVKTMINERGM